MTEQVVTLVAASIAAFAAIVAALASLYSVYYQASRSSNLRLAEFRKEWIEDLRIKMSEFLSYTVDLGIRIENLKKKAGENDIIVDEDFFERSNRQGEAYAFIALSINADEKTHKELLELMGRMMGTKSSDIGALYEELGYNFIEKSKEVLKGEWNRLKREM